MAGLRSLEGLCMNTLARVGAERAGEPVRGEKAAGDTWAELRLEIARSRRFGRPFGLIRIEGKTVPRLGAALRSIDRAWTVDRVTYLLLPETDRDAAQAVRGRLLRESPEALASCSLSVAAFPEDGLTSGALLKALRTTKERAHAPESRPAFVSLADSPGAHA
jgi:hypothetical protein